MHTDEDLFHSLRAAHAALQVAVDQIATDNSVVARKGLFEDFAHDWRRHEAAEQDVLYPRMRQVPALKGLAHSFQNELDDIERVIRELEARPVGSEAWVERFEEVRDLVALHFDRMEDDGFRQIRKHLAPDALEEIRSRIGAHGDKIIQEVSAVA